MWSSTNEAIFQQLLIDSNHDGFVDGVTACFVPLTPATVTPQLWAAMANLAARLGLEAPAIHLPLVITEAEIQPWQCPLFLSWNGSDGPVRPQHWVDDPSSAALVDQTGLRVVWVTQGQQRGLWLHGVDPADVAGWLNQIANAAPESATTKEAVTPPGNPLGASPTSGGEIIAPPLAPKGHPPLGAGEAGRGCKRLHHDLDLATLFTGEGQGFFTATHDGFTPDNTYVRLLLGPETTAEVGAAAVNLAARLGLETAGITFPLAIACAEIPQATTDEEICLLGFPIEASAQWETTLGARQHHLGLPMTHYLATTYPFLNAVAHQTGDEQQTIQEILACLRSITHAHTPVAKLALAEVQAGRPLHLLVPGSSNAANLRRVVFRQEWNPPDGLDDRQRIYRTFVEQAVPFLQQDQLAGQAVQITLFCNAPAPARQALATACRAHLHTRTTEFSLQVLPAHKAGLAWLLEEQLPRLQQCNVAQVKLYFREFCAKSFSESVKEKWLDLPTRWLQELFPADELLAQRLGLPVEQVQIQMVTAADAAVTDQTAASVYRLEAFDEQGALVHTDELDLLWTERLYMSGLPQFGLIHPTTGGVIVRGADGVSTSWPTPTDDALFWDFYQESVLPALRQHLLTGSGGRPTPAREPYFDRLEVEVAIGAPDEPLGIFEEFISLGEALHEDIYFNTLDYFAALGEAFGGQSIAAAGQVVPMIHDYYQADGEPITRPGPRATVTLHDWAVPCHLPDRGLTVGDRRDMPLPTSTRVCALTVDESGTTVCDIAVEVTYPDAKQAHFADRVLEQWRTLACAQTGFPPGIALTVHCCAGSKSLADITFAAAPEKIEKHEPTAQLAHQSDSAVIGLQQLEAQLPELAQQPGIRVWQVGRSYQGRPGHVIDVTLPLETHQTHSARRKLTLQKPTLFFVARHHANEVSSTTTALQMVRDAVTDPTQRQWLERVNLVFLPMANPDGAALHYALMAEHPRWKHHAARFNAAGKEFGGDHFDPNTPFGEARFRHAIWSRWLPDAIVDNHGVPSHEWCQPFAGYTTPPRFPVCYHVVQAMLYGIITFADDPALPQLHEGARQAAAALRSAVAQAVAATPWLYERNQYWLRRYQCFGHQWLPDLSPVDLHEGMLFFYRGVVPAQLPETRRNFAMRHPQITLLDWITEVPDETAQGAYLAECAAAHRVANDAMIELLAESAAPVVRVVEQGTDGRVWIGLRRERRIGGEEA